MRELLTFALGLISAYLATRWKARKDLEADYDRDLRGARIAAYRELWKLLEPLARYAPRGPLTAPVAAGLAAELRHWYFHIGGLFLSDDSRGAYFDLQDALKAALAGGLLDEEAAAVLRARGSALRTATAADVGTRRSSALRGA